MASTADQLSRYQLLAEAVHKGVIERVCIWCGISLRMLDEDRWYCDWCTRDTERPCIRCGVELSGQLESRIACVYCPDPLDQERWRIARALRRIDRDLPRTLIPHLYLEQQGLCANPYCRAVLARTDYHIDHVVPLSRGGTSEAGNLQLLCPPCNRSKGAKFYGKWLKEQERAKQPA